MAENLRRGLAVVLRGVTNRSSLPILSGTMIKMGSDGLELLTTDLEISFRVKVGAKVKEVGEMVVPAKLFYDLVSGLPVGPMDLISEKQTLKLNSGSVKAEIVGQAAEEFPSLPKSKGKSMKIGVDEFRKKIDRVSLSAARDDTQPVLSGVLWEFKKNGIRLAATDRYRLAVDELVKLKLDEKMEGKKKILPARALQELSRVLADGQIRELGVELDEEKQQVLFVAESVEMASRLIAGDFPPFEQILPSNHSLRAEIGREELSEAVKRASLFAGDGSSIVKIKFDKGVIEVAAENSQRGSSETKITIKMEGDGLQMAFNSRYLLDYLGVVEDEFVIMESDGELKPGVFKTKDEGFIQVVMPIRLQE